MRLEKRIKSAKENKIIQNTEQTLKPIGSFKMKLEPVFTQNIHMHAHSVFNVSIIPTEVNTILYVPKSAKKRYTITIFTESHIQSCELKCILLLTISKDRATDATIAAKSSPTSKSISLICLLCFFINFLSLFDRYALGEVARLVHVITPEHA